MKRFSLEKYSSLTANPNIRSWLTVSFRQNGVGPSKSCADAILPKGHGPAAYICDQCILLAAGVLPEPIPQPNSKPNSRSGHENGINERVHEVETVARPTTGAEEERDAGVGR